MKCATILVVILLALTGCAKPGLSAHDRIVQVSKMDPADPSSRDKVEAEMISDPHFSRAAVTTALFDKDSEIRCVSAVVVAQTPPGFHNVDVVRYWTTFGAGKDNATLFIANVVAKEKSGFSHDVWRNYLTSTATPSKTVVVEYCMNDEPFVIAELKARRVPASVLATIEHYAKENGASRIGEALKSK